MFQFLSIFFLGFLQFLLGFSKVPVFLCHSVCRPLKFYMSLLFVFVCCRIVPLFVEFNSILLSNILSFFYPYLLPSFIPLSKIGALSQAFCRRTTFFYFFSMAGFCFMLLSLAVGSSRCSKTVSPFLTFPCRISISLPSSLYAL